MGVFFTCPRCRQNAEHTEYGIHPLIAPFPVYGCRACGALWVLRTVQEIIPEHLTTAIDPTGRAQDQHETSAHASNRIPGPSEGRPLPLSPSGMPLAAYETALNPSQPPLDLPVTPLPPDPPWTRSNIEKRLREYGLGDPGDEVVDF